MYVPSEYMCHLYYMLLCSQAPFLHIHPKHLTLIAQAGYIPSPHLALQGQATTNNHNLGFWHSWASVESAPGNLSHFLYPRSR